MLTRFWMYSRIAASFWLCTTSVLLQADDRNAAEKEPAATEARATQAKAEAASAEDSAFARRTLIDLTGRSPTAAELQFFVENQNPEKLQNWLYQLGNQIATDEPTLFWIGVECHPLEPVVRQALKLPEETGIIVARVSENSPASKAGLKVGDIIRQWRGSNDEAVRIKDVETLIKLVQEHGTKQADKAATLEITRDGEAMSIAIQPAKREIALPAIAGLLATQNQTAAADKHEGAAAENMRQKWQLDTARSGLEFKLAEARAKLEEGKARFAAARAKLEDVRQRVESATETRAALAQADAEVKIAQAQLELAQAQYRHAEAHLNQYQDWTKAMSSHGFQLPNPGAANFDVLIPAPGIVTDRLISKPLELPDDLKITIVREGKKPARVTIERGEKKYEATSETVKDIPAELRPFVDQMLTPSSSRMLRLFQTQGNEAPGRVELRLPEEARPPQPVMPLAPPRVVIHATPQVQPPPTPVATQKQLDDLQKALEQLRKQVEQMEKK